MKALNWQQLKNNHTQLWYILLLWTCLLIFFSNQLSATVLEPNVITNISYNKNKQSLTLLWYLGYEYGVSKYSLDDQKETSHKTYGEYEEIERIQAGEVQLQEISTKAIGLTATYKAIGFNNLFTPDGYTNFDRASNTPPTSTKWEATINLNGKYAFSQQFHSCAFRTNFEIRAYSLPNADFTVFVFAPIQICYEFGYRSEFYVVLKTPPHPASVFTKPTPYTKELDKASLWKLVLNKANSLFEKGEQKKASQLYWTLYHKANTQNLKEKAVCQLLLAQVSKNNYEEVYSLIRRYYSELQRENKTDKTVTIHIYKSKNLSKLKSKKWLSYLISTPEQMPPTLEETKTVSGFAHYGQLELLKDLVKNGGDIHECLPKYNYSPLVIATKHRHIEIVKYLIEQGATDFKRCFEKNKSIGLIEAVKNNDTAIARLLIPVSTMNEVDWNIKTSLIYACSNGNVPIAKMLLKNGADSTINHKERYGKTALHFAVQSKSPELVKLLINHNAQLNTAREKRLLLYDVLFKNNDTVTASVLSNAWKSDTTHQEILDEFLCKATLSEKNRKVITLFLLNQGANPNTLINKSPLFHRLISENKDSAIIIMLPYVNPNLKGYMDNTNLSLALYKKKYWMADSLLSYGANINYANGELLYQSIRNKDSLQYNYLLQKGANTESKDKYGGTVLIRLIESRDSVAIKTLINLGADINAADNKNKSVLSYAVQNSPSVSIYSSLIDKGASINNQCNKGNTALHYAVMSNNAKAVKTLLHYKALQLKNNKKEKPIAIARKHKRKEIVKLLKGAH